MSEKAKKKILFSPYISTYIIYLITNKRILAIIGVFSFGLGITSFLYPELYSEILFFFNIYFKEKSDTRILLLLLGSFSFSLLYLQSGEKNKDNILLDKITKNLLEKINYNRNETRELKIKLEKVLDGQNTIVTKEIITEEDKKTIILKTIDNLEKNIIESVIKKHLNEMEKSQQEPRVNSEITDYLLKPEKRILSEIRNLSLRANFNLAIGMIITAAGLILLLNTVNILDTSENLKELSQKGDETNSIFLKNIFISFIPRFSLFVFIEVFAYFFLKLYKSGLDEIKYYQNELTNIQLKSISTVISLSSNQTEALRISLDSLSNTERNFILNKDQTTVSLEKAKTDTKIVNNLIKYIPKYFKNQN
ncbi:hypothetical protein EHQ47_16925 [Leptospira bourretii]|uniref:hypothetical protein n=1 Tax=Leptospira bourretii TaxID=2484962 RepID=UPI0010911112|nr:hypothetical protein [Leptospira bourretii]TGL19780.1 hypothetical protein EHQ47_16925 [Leptospira bourretii]